MLGNPESILVIDASSFGSSLMLLPAMRALRTSFPDSLITVAASTGICELISAEALSDKTIDLGSMIESGNASFRAVQRFFKLIQAARRNSFDLVVDFTPRTETQIARWITHKGRTVSPWNPLEALEKLVGRSRTREREGIARHKQVLAQMGIKCEDRALDVAPTREESARFEKLLERNNGAAAPLVVFFCKDPRSSNGWAPDKFAEIANLLTTNLGIRTIAVDSPASRAFSSRLTGLFPPKAILLRQPGASQVVAALARASLLITDDPGLAAAVIAMGTPTIELRGGRRTERVGEAHVAIGQAAPDAAVQIRDAASELLVMSRTSALFQR